MSGEIGFEERAGPDRSLLVHRLAAGPQHPAGRLGHRAPPRPAWPCTGPVLALEPHETARESLKALLTGWEVPGIAPELPEEFDLVAQQPPLALPRLFAARRLPADAFRRLGGVALPRPAPSPALWRWPPA
jgi:hypothetical protein